VIQLTRRGVVFSGSQADLRRLRVQFNRDHYIVLPKLVEPELLDMILRRIEGASFPRYNDDGITFQVTMDDPATFDLLLFLVNNPAFHRIVQRATGCRKIANFRGRVYRMIASENHHIRWHSDVHDHRLVSFSLNLTPGAFQGGALQIRNRDSVELLHEVRNTGLGDAVLFRVTRKLLHRVLPVEGDMPRTAMAGWFRWEKEDFHSELRRASKSVLAASPDRLAKSEAAAEEPVHSVSRERQ
jgi:2OG-Fe(II) oxygenase superfamily